MFCPSSGAKKIVGHCAHSWRPPDDNKSFIKKT